MQPLTTCDELKDWLGAYVIGATTPSENLAIKRLLDICPEARALLDDYLLVRDALTHLDTASHNAPRPNSLIASLPMPIAPPTKLTHANEHRQQPQPVPETLEKLRPAPAPARTRAFPIAAWYAFGGVAAALILVFGVLVVVDQFLTEMRAEREQLMALVTQSSTEAAPTLPMNQSPVTRHMMLYPTQAGSNGLAQVVWDAETRVGMLVVNNMPELPEGEHYQMWLVEGNSIMSMGAFQVDESGSGVLVFRAPQPLTAYDLIGVNIEPTATPEQPTRPHLMIREIGA